VRRDYHVRGPFRLIAPYTRLQRWLRRKGWLTHARKLGWVPTRDQQRAIYERDMNIREIIRLEAKISGLNRRIGAQAKALELLFESNVKFGEKHGSLAMGFERAAELVGEEYGLQAPDPNLPDFDSTVTEGDGDG
jgi:hypothetical protein